MKVLEHVVRKQCTAPVNSPLFFGLLKENCISGIKDLSPFELLCLILTLQLSEFLVMLATGDVYFEYIGFSYQPFHSH
jgi:hypothetical protein